MQLSFPTELESCKELVIPAGISRNKTIRQNQSCPFRAPPGPLSSTTAAAWSQRGREELLDALLMFCKGISTVGSLLTFPFLSQLPFFGNLICFTPCQTWQKSLHEFRSYCDEGLTDKFHFLRKPG